MTGKHSHNSTSGHIDWWSIAIWAGLAILGWINLYAAVYDGSGGIFDMKQLYGKQLLWIGVSTVMAVVIMLLDDKYYHMFAYPAYIAGILLLLSVFVLGREIKGAQAWISVGGFQLQPGEFVKFTTSLALARYMSKYTFSVRNIKDLVAVFAIMFLPALIIILQNDTGSAVVYGAFLLVLFREGLNGWVYVALIMAILLFIGSFLLTPTTILIVLILICLVGEGILNGRWKEKLMFGSLIALVAILLYFGSAFLMGGHGLSIYTCLLISTGLSLILAVTYAYRNRLRNVYLFIILFIGSISFTATVDYVFDKMQLHQQKRVLIVLGLESDPQNWGYNVIQSEIAIGSGGLTGKGFLGGTQTRFDFVPEQTTDFIFSTLGEEWGFIGTLFTVSLFCLLVLRLMKMGEGQKEPFGRIYCYCVAAVFFAHTIINIGMTIGIMPVIGIPLPFFSYGGSSFLAFTLMFFVAVRLDAGKRELMR